jgi:SNF2 family DNA or RNA helicase
MTQKVISYFKREGIGVCLEAEVIDLLSCGDELRQELTLAIEGGKAIKEGNISSGEVRPFLEFISTTLVRPLKIHQVKASLHLLTVRNGANFSVPGSGKTSVVLAVFEYLRKLGIVDRLFVAGPPSCFGPWRQEYEAVIGIAPRLVILAGGSVEDRRQTYASSPSADLYLTSYHTLHRDCDLLAKWLRQNGSRVFLVLDEAHYIKQLGGAWATAVLALTEFTARRCILTGTPFPRVYSDAFNLFDALWPHSTPLTTEDRIRIDMYSEAGETNNATKLLEKAVGALFYRVRKSDLGLAPQIFHPPIRIKMSPYEKMAYDEIMARVKEASRTDDLHDIDLVLRLRRGRMMRLRQSVSYAKLLATALAEYPEELVKGKLSLTDVLTRYDDLEQPAKLEALCSLVRRLREKGEKVLIWSNFVRTLHLIRGTLTGLGDSVELIYGETPTENVTLSEELTREKIIKNFTSGSTEILVANPAACAESISLHKSCAHAIYYDLSYNCAQYLQSLDRIHRVGGSENRSAHYYFLQYDDTIDADILENVLRKAERMSALIDRDYPIYSLDMFDADDELKAYERLFA